MLKDFWLMLRSGEFLAVMEYLVKINFFDYLVEPRTNEEIVNHFGYQKNKFDALALYLKSLDYLEEDNAKLKLTDFSDKHLVSSSKYYLGHYVLWRLKSFEHWRANIDKVMTGKMNTVHAEKQYLDNSDPLVLEGITMGCGFVHPSKEFAEKVAGELSGSLIDIGCGTGIWSFEIASSNPDLDINLLDINLDIAKSINENIYPNTKVNFINADMFSDKFKEVENVLMSNVLTDWEDEKVDELINKIAEETKCEKLLIHEFVLDQEILNTSYNLMVNMETRGRIRAKEWWEKLLNKNFSSIEFKKLTFGSYVIVAKK